MPNQDEKRVKFCSNTRHSKRGVGTGSWKGAH